MRDDWMHGQPGLAMDRMEKLIRKHGSLRAAARVLGVSAAFLSDVRRGRREPGPKLCKALGVQKRVKVTREVRYFLLGGRGTAQGSDG